MCLLDHDTASRRYRTLLVIASLCLALALTSQSLNLAFGLPPLPIHFLRGFLLGISIALNLGAVMIARRARRIAPASGQGSHHGSFQS